MNESIEEADSEIETEVSTEERSVLAKLGWGLFGIFFLAILVLMGVKAFRDQKPTDVSIRFVRNNEVIKQQTGGIVRIQGYGKLVLSGNSWETTGKIFGSKNDIEVKVYGSCGDGTSDSGSHCSVSEAKYRMATDGNESDWHEIEIGWAEKILLSFK